jgi:ABC-type transport system involved in Fe-S cluster assembly fused permease/ATPase subunit
MDIAAFGGAASVLLPRRKRGQGSVSIGESNEETSFIPKIEKIEFPLFQNKKVVFDGVTFGFDKERPLFEELSFQDTPTSLTARSEIIS